MAVKPNKWIAGFFAFLSPWLGMLYVAKPPWAAVYLFAFALIVILYFWVDQFSPIIFLAPAATLIGIIHTVFCASRYDINSVRPWYSKWYVLLAIYILFFALVFIVRAFLFEPFRVASGSMMPTLLPGKHVVAKKWGYGNNGSYGVTLHKGGISAQIQRGDVLVFVYPSKNEHYDYLMRVVGLPGEFIEYKQKSLIINGVPAEYRDQGQYSYTRHDSNRVVASVRTEKMGTAEYSVMTIPDLPAIQLAHLHAFPNKQNCVFNYEGFTCRIPEKHYFMMGDNRDASNDSRYWGFVPEDHIVGKVINLPQ